MRAFPKVVLTSAAALSLVTAASVAQELEGAEAAMKKLDPINNIAEGSARGLFLSGDRTERSYISKLSRDDRALWEPKPSRRYFWAKGLAGLSVRFFFATVSTFTTA